MKKNLWQKKYFGRLFSVFAMLLVGVFFTNSFASASTEEIIHYNSSSQNLNFTATTSGTVICSARAYYIRANISFWLDNTNEGSRFIDILNDGLEGYGKNFIFYKQVEAGEHSLIISADTLEFGNNGSSLSCFFDSDNLVYNSQKFSSSVNNSNGFYEGGLNGFLNTGQKLLLVNFFGDNGKDLSPLIYSNSTLLTKISLNGSNPSPKVSNYLYSEIENNIIINNYISAYGNYMYSNLEAYLFDYEVASPPSNDYVMYYGNNPSYTIRRKPFNFPVVYNVCDDYAETSNYYRLRFNKDDNTYQDSAPIGTENNPCSGVYTFSEIAPDYEDSGTGYISIIDDMGIDIASTSPFLYTVYTPVGQIGAFIKPRFKSPVYADYFQATSTDLIFDYDVCIDENFDTNSEICIDFVDTRAMGQLDYNKTDFCQTLSNCKGQVNIPFPIASGDMTAYFRASYYSSNLPDSPFVSSNPFLFTLYNSDAKDTANIFSQSSIHEMACSAEDWASEDWWDEMKCGTFETTLNGLNSIVNGLKLTINKTIRLFTNIFPFNFITKINECWEDSEFSSLPTELETINFLDNDGNVKIGLPSEWSESGSITLWGTDIFQANQATKVFFDFIRNLSRYALWAMFIFGVYQTAYDVYGEIMVAKINKRNDDSNYQR